MAGLKEQFKNEEKSAKEATPTRKKPRARPSLNGRNVLTVEGQEPGYQYRVVNDVGGRVERLKEQGYEVVLDKDVRVGERRVATPTPEGSAATVHVGGGITGVVMRQRKEWFDEDQAEKQRYVDELEKGTLGKGSSLADYGKVETSRD